VATKIGTVAMKKAIPIMMHRLCRMGPDLIVHGTCTAYRDVCGRTYAAAGAHFGRCRWYCDPMPAGETLARVLHRRRDC
jgi:hypothetical protein